MVTDLLLPKRGIVVPEVPSYIKLDMAFALGKGTKLGDKSRYRSHGTISGASWATGAHGKCLDFDASAKDFVSIPAAHTQLNFTSEKFSIIARIKIDSLTAHRAIFIRGWVSEDGYEFYIDKAGLIIFKTNQLDANQWSGSAAGQIVTGNWYTLGLSRDGASAIPYKNGADVHDTAGTHIDPLTCARTAKIGIHDNLTAYPFAGKIEFLRVFGGITLSAKEHLAYHNALA